MKNYRILFVSGAEASITATEINPTFDNSTTIRGYVIKNNSDVIGYLSGDKVLMIIQKDLCTSISPGK